MGTGEISTAGCSIHAHESLGIFQYLSYLMRDNLNAKETEGQAVQVREL